MKSVFDVVDQADWFRLSVSEISKKYNLVRGSVWWKMRRVNPNYRKLGEPKAIISDEDFKNLTCSQMQKKYGVSSWFVRNQKKRRTNV